jgi:hypothetical protein
MNRHVQTFLNDLDKSLEKELNSSLNLLGSKLASLSTQFVKDYKPLTIALQDLIQTTRLRL